MESLVWNPKNKCHRIKKHIVKNGEIADLLLCQLLFLNIFLGFVKRILAGYILMLK